MKPLLFVKADDFETFGVGPRAIADAGGEIRVWEAIAGHEPPHLDDVAGVVMFGSTYNVEHADEQPFIGEMRAVTLEALDRGVPYLGICFGAQVLAWSLGSPIDKAPVREVGYLPLRPLPAAADDPLLSVYEDGDAVLQWHMDTFELPPDAELLAVGDEVQNQAYRVGDAAWATQFHLEVDLPELESWLDAVHDTVERDWGKGPGTLREEAAAHHEGHEERGREVFARFLKVARERA
jgi:GMP synthase (glutamine-hydrolysing)